jgi:hypothetical protein
VNPEQYITFFRIIWANVLDSILEGKPLHISYFALNVLICGSSGFHTLFPHTMRGMGDKIPVAIGNPVGTHEGLRDRF